MKKFALGLILILLVSGCAGFDLSGIIPGLGGGNKVNTSEASSDLIVIQNIRSIPSSPINSGDTFSVSFELVNQDEIKDVPITYELFDYGLCTPPPTSNTSGGVTIAPLGTEWKEWSFTAPGNDKIGGLSTKCPIRFKVSYNWDSKSQIDVDVISVDRYNELQRAGQFPTFTPTLTVGRGPIKIYFTFGATLPIRSGTTLPIFITVEDKGTGLLGSLTQNKLKLSFEGLSDVDCGDRFTSCVSGSCSNSAEIPLIRKKTPQLRCTAKAPTNVTIEKTFYITATLNYDYDIIGETIVEVKPFLT